MGRGLPIGLLTLRMRKAWTQPAKICPTWKTGRAAWIRLRADVN